MRWLDLLLVVSLAASGSALSTARDQLARGELDQVLLTLEGQSFSGPERAEAAQLLAEAGRRGLAQDDSLFALQCAQRALRDAPKLPLALEVGARAGLAQRQLDLAEGYANRWAASRPQDAAPRLLRAEIAAQEGDWAEVVHQTAPLRASTLSPAERAQKEQLTGRAHAALAAQTPPSRPPDGLAQKLMEARAQQREAERQEDLSAARPADRAPFVDDDDCWGFCAERARTPRLDDTFDPDDWSETHWVDVGPRTGHSRGGGHSAPSAPVGSGRPPLLPN